MDEPEDGVAVYLGIGDDPDRDQVVNVLKSDPLLLHLLVDAVKVLRPALYLALVPVLSELLFHDLDEIVYVRLALDTALIDLLDQFFVGLGVKVHERKVFKFDLDPGDTHAIGERRVDIEGFLGNALLFFRGERFEGAHVVKPVGQFDENDPDVLGHGHDHLAEVLGLALFAALELHAGDLCHAVHQSRDLLTEHLFEFFRRGGGIFDGIVEQAGRHRGRVELEIGEDGGHFDGMVEIGLARETHLSLMHLGREDIGAPQKVHIGIGIVFLDALNYVFETNCRHDLHQAPGSKHQIANKLQIPGFKLQTF